MLSGGGILKTSDSLASSLNGGVELAITVDNNIKLTEPIKEESNNIFENQVLNSVKMEKNKKKSLPADLAKSSSKSSSNDKVKQRNQSLERTKEKTDQNKIKSNDSKIITNGINKSKTLTQPPPPTPPATTLNDSTTINPKKRPYNEQKVNSINDNNQLNEKRFKQSSTSEDQNNNNNKTKPTISRHKTQTDLINNKYSNEDNSILYEY